MSGKGASLVDLVQKRACLARGVDQVKDIARKGKRGERLHELDPDGSEYDDIDGGKGKKVIPWRGRVRLRPMDGGVVSSCKWDSRRATLAPGALQPGPLARAQPGRRHGPLHDRRSHNYNSYKYSPQGTTGHCFGKQVARSTKRNRLTQLSGRLSLVVVLQPSALDCIDANITKHALSSFKSCVLRAGHGDEIVDRWDESWSKARLERHAY